MKKTVLLTLVSASVTISADIGPPIDIAAQSRGASRVVLGQVLDVQSRFASNQFGDQLIVSDVLVDVLETMKGSPQSRLYVALEGGTVGDLTLKVSDLPALQPGERAVFFLEGQDGIPLRPRGRGRGILKLAQDDHVQGSSQTLGDLRREIRSALGQGGRK
jgi:hypothetical protein